MRRDQASTPPNPDSAMVAKVMNNSHKLGRGGCGGCGGCGGADAGDGAEAVGDGSLERGIGAAFMKFV